MTAQLDQIDSTREKQAGAQMFEDVNPEKPIPTAEKYDRFGARKYNQCLNIIASRHSHIGLV
jgi:hypothetical protein